MLGWGQHLLYCNDMCRQTTLLVRSDDVLGQSAHSAARHQLTELINCPSTLSFCSFWTALRKLNLGLSACFISFVLRDLICLMQLSLLENWIFSHSPLISLWMTLKWEIFFFQLPMSHLILCSLMDLFLSCPISSHQLGSDDLMFTLAYTNIIITIAPSSPASTMWHLLVKPNEMLGNIK